MLDEKFSWIEKGLLVAVLLALFGIGMSEIHSFDVFWQLQSGKYILQTKSFIYTDIFSLASDAPRHEHCWLHDIILYLLYLTAGYAGISVWKGLMVLAMGVAAVAAARIRGASWLAILFVVPPTLALTRGGWLERPQLWTFLFFVLFVLLLEHFKRHGGRSLFLLLPLMALWANLHAAFILGLAVLAAYLVGAGGSWLIKHPELPAGGGKKLLVVSLFVLGAAFLTPYPSYLLGTLLSQIRLVMPQAAGGGAKAVAVTFNMDWRSTSFFRDPYFFYAMAAAGLLLLLGWRRLRLTDICLLGGLTLMGMQLSRHTPLTFLAIAVILPVYADAAVRPLTNRLGGVAKPTLRVAAQAACCALILFLFMPAYRVYGLFETGLRTWHYPIEAAQFVEKHELPTNLFNTYDWGGYLMWTLYPDYKVFWDGRSDSHEMFRQGLAVMNGRPGWEQILDRFQVNTIVTKACTVDTGQRYPFIDKLRDHKSWALVFADESSLVFVRSESMDKRWLDLNTLPERRIDDTILSEAGLLIGTNSNRYMAYRELYRIAMKRRDYRNALWAVQRYLAKSPKRDIHAERTYRMLRQRYGG